MDQVEKVVQGTDTELPPEFVAQLVAADAVIMVSTGEDNVLRLGATIKGGVYHPEQVKTHALVAAIYDEYPNLVNRVMSTPTDADRYRALRDFSMLAHSNPERFELVNDIIRRLEEAAGMTDDAATRTADEHDTFADMVCQALVETEPAAFVAPSDEQKEGLPKAIITSGTKIILPPDAKLN